MVYIILGKGFEEIEAIAPGDILRRARIPMKYVGIGGTEIEGAHGIVIHADLTIEELEYQSMEMIVLPGGGDGVAAIEANQRAMDAVTYAVENHLIVAAICAAPSILGKRGWLNGKNAVCYPGFETVMEGASLKMDQQVVRDDNFITARAPGAAIEFGLELAGALHGEYTPEEICDYMVYRRVK